MIDWLLTFTRCCAAQLLALLSASPLVADTRLHSHILSLESLFANLFTDGDVSSAKVRDQTRGFWEFWSARTQHCSEL
jgi:hypothetical protein